MICLVFGRLVGDTLNINCQLEILQFAWLMLIECSDVVIMHSGANMRGS